MLPRPEMDRGYVTDHLDNPPQRIYLRYVLQTFHFQSIASNYFFVIIANFSMKLKIESLISSV